MTCLYVDHLETFRFQNILVRETKQRYDEHTAVSNEA